MPWKKGQSGNPKGGPPGANKASEARRLAADLRSRAQPELVRFLLRVVADESADMRDRIAATKCLLDESAVKVEVSSTVNQTVTHVVEVSDARRKLAERLAAAGVSIVDSRGSLGSGVRAPAAQLVDLGTAGAAPAERTVDAVADPSGPRVGKDADGS